MPFGRTVGVLVVASSVLASHPAAAVRGEGRQTGNPAADVRPKLIVLVVVDQFRADYVTEYGHQWSKGLHDLLSSGAVFTDAVVPYAVTRTCTGHATISTGTFPSTHGLIDNDWFDRTGARFVSCTEDRSVEPVGYGPGPVGEHHSARAMRAPTFADELRRQAKRTPQVVSLGLKARSAVSLVGQGGARTTAAWEEDSGTWATSTAFAKVPSAYVTSYVKTHRSLTSMGWIWDRLLPGGTYRYDDAAPGEPAGGTFPRPVASPLGMSFVAVWDGSPLSDAYIADLATSLVGDLKLGQEPGTDLLALGFAALDYVGHRFGPRSHEVQDILARLDTALGTLLDTLDRSIGRANYVVALTSDHGVAPLPEQGGGPGNPGGRVSLSAIGRAVETAVSLSLGRRTSVEAISGSAVYLEPGVLDRIRAAPEARRLVEQAVTGVPGVARVYWADDLAATQPTDDATLAAMRRSYVADRSGDLMFVPARYWVVADGGTQHGSPHDYDVRVPLLFAGGRIQARRVSSAASLVDVAPTLAALAGITMTRSEGRILNEVVER